MKPRLLLYLTSDRQPARNAIAATLAWAARSAGWFFEVYYDAYRLGEHYGGGDPAWQPDGTLTGGTMIGGHHHERLYLLLHRFDTVVLMDGPVAFAPTLAQLDVPRLEVVSQADMYLRAFEVLGVALPDTAVLVDAQPRRDLAGLDAYLYPEIVERQALGLEASTLSADDLRQLFSLGLRHLRTCCVGSAGLRRMEDAAVTSGVPLVRDALDALQADDDFASVTERVAHRWLSAFPGGWILADPGAVASWLPEAVRERRLAIYSKPQHVIIERLREELSASTTAVLGRQYEDRDFFDLSALGATFQLIDPCRPPFPVLRHAGYTWAPERVTAGVNGEPDDDQLRAWAREGRVLVSVIFWTGMVRELENLHRVVDLVALTRMRGGLALTVPAIEYQPEAPLELLRVPLERGGVFPHLEVLLASCGLGAAIESLLPEGRLAGYLRATHEAFDRLSLPEALRPRGWWATMDPRMMPLPRPRLPVVLAAQRQPPYLRVRYQSPAAAPASRARDVNVEAETQGAVSGTPIAARRRPGLKRRLGDWARDHGLREMLAPYRPYEFYAPGPFQPETVAALRGAGLRYMFSKAGFGRPPMVLYQDAEFVALNYTVGHWDGWTPFETINHLEDLRQAERRLVAARRPGWLVGTLDTCLWAFTGPVWQRGAELRAIAEFLARGGDSGRLINVTPGVVARYARILGERSSFTRAEDGAAVGVRHQDGVAI